MKPISSQPISTETIITKPIRTKTISTTTINTKPIRSPVCHPQHDSNLDLSKHTEHVAASF